MVKMADNVILTIQDIYRIFLSCKRAKMRAEVKPRICLENRTRLETVIPLSTPYLVFLDPSDRCNMKCEFCPTGSGEARRYKKPQLLDFNLYQKIIDDLCDMPEPIKTLRLYKDGEPLLNSRFADMVKYAKETGNFGQVDTTTNGSLLTIKMSRKIVNAGLDKIFVSVPKDYTSDYIENIAYLHGYSYGTETCKVYVKIIDDGLDKEYKEKFFQDFGNFADQIFIEHLASCWPEFKVENVGNMGIYGQPIKEVQVCPYCLYSLAINPDGTVSQCFLDWPHQMILGDLKKESLKNIWNSSMLRDFQIMQLRGERHNHPFCSKCGQLKYGYPDNIDQYAKEILKRLK